MVKRIGVDLGTTNSLAAVVEPTGIRILARLPSVIAETEDGRIVVGSEARLTHASRYRYSHVKRYMGTDKSFEFSRAAIAAAGIEGAPGDKPSVGRLSAAQISAQYLAELCRQAAVKLNCLTDELEIVVTIPAYFHEPQMQDTRIAADIAGLRLLSLVPEPVAAAVAYAESRKSESPHETFVVYDLGGGTFDAAVCVRTQREIVLGARGTAYGGYTALGGRDLDAILIRMLLEQNGLGSLAELQESSLHETTSPGEVWALRNDAEREREKLSDEEIVYPSLALKGNRLDGAIKRVDFERCIASEVERTIEISERVVAQHGESLGRPVHIDRVVCVGGAARTPLVLKRLKETFKGIPVQLEDPDLAVAKGAALYSLQCETAATTVDWVDWKESPVNRIDAEHAAYPQLSGMVRVTGGSQIQLVAEDGQVASCEVAADGSFVLSPLPLRLGTQQVELRLLDARRNVLEQTAFPVLCGGYDLPQPCLAHDILVRLRNAERRPLLRRGTAPGTSQTVTLYVRDTSNLIAVPLLEGHTPLGRQEWQVPTQPGTKVAVTTTYEPGAIRLRLQVGAAPPLEERTLELDRRSVWTSSELLQKFAALRGEVESMLETLRKELNVYEYEEEARRLVTAIELSADVELDPQRVQELLNELESLRDRLRFFEKSPDGMHMRAVAFLSIVHDPRHRSSLEGAIVRLKKLSPNDVATLREIEAVLADVGRSVLLEDSRSSVSLAEVESLAAKVEASLRRLSDDALAAQLEDYRKVLKLRRTEAGEPNADLRSVYERLVQLNDEVNRTYFDWFVEHAEQGLLAGS